VELENELNAYIEEYTTCAKKELDNEDAVKQLHNKPHSLTTFGTSLLTQMAAHSLSFHIALAYMARGATSQRLWRIMNLSHPSGMLEMSGMMGKTANISQPHWGHCAQRDVTAELFTNRCNVMNRTSVSAEKSETIKFSYKSDRRTSHAPPSLFMTCSVSTSCSSIAGSGR